jgi:outer membrane protein OmpA-like peptidoglycan-associated protein/opacity protein-like surface antigen
MKTYSLGIAIFCAISFNYSSGQELQLTSKDSIVTSSWMIGLGYNFVDDSGDMVKELFDFKDQWNAVAFPSRLSVGSYFKNGLGVEAIGTYNKYKVGKLIDGSINSTEMDYFGFDARLSYDLNKVIGETSWFDPYVGIGIGYSEASNEGRGTYNAVVGFRTWFSDRFGLDFSSSGKWTMDNSLTNHLQHAASLMYRFDIEKGLSKKGLETLAQIEENQRVSDSIAAAKIAEEEARRMAERLAQEKEKARLAAEEQARKEAEDRRKTELENKIKDLGNVYFSLNSSYLNKPYKELLDRLTVIMEENPTLTLKIGSHADSRGAEKYNQWLSEKRVKQTLDYLIDKKGINASRLTGEGFGETQLVNECDNNTYCPESKHKLNRRSEFEVVAF